MAMTFSLKSLKLPEVTGLGGAVAGFFVGGPIGALIGAVAGAGAGYGWDYAATKGLVKPPHSVPLLNPGNAAGPATPVTPPGIPQPPGIVMVPPAPSPSSDLDQAAAALVTFLNSNPPTQDSIPVCVQFQQLYNQSKPAQALATDGLYGPKTQAALQASIAPAVAPGNYFPSDSQVAPPTVSAAPPTLNVDVLSAANVLLQMSSIGKESDSNVTTFQHAYNGHNPSPQLVEDGKYGPMTQAALQSVIDWASSQGQAMASDTAPPNGYGAMASEPVFPG
jgi:hypothetical protein